MKYLKSVVSLVLLLTFLSSTSGISVYKHYCGDFLAEISIYFQADPCSDEGGEDACSKGKTTSCCDNETDYYKLEVEVVKQLEKKQNVNFQAILIASIVEKESVNIEQKKSANRYIDLPPLDTIPIYKKYSRYTFYG